MIQNRDKINHNTAGGIFLGAAGGYYIGMKEAFIRVWVNNVKKGKIQLLMENLIKHPCFDEMRTSGKGYRVAGTLENTDRILTDTFWIGVYPGMTDEMLDAMAEAIKEAL